MGRHSHLKSLSWMLKVVTVFRKMVTSVWKEGAFCLNAHSCLLGLWWGLIPHSQRQALGS